MIQKSNYQSPAMEVLEVRYAVSIMSNVSASVINNMAIWDEQEI